MHDQFTRDGYLVVPGLLSPQEAQDCCQRYTDLRTNGTFPLDHKGVGTEDADPILQYPRMTHVQRWDGPSLKQLTAPRLNQYLTELMGQEPYLVQGMVYFKPPLSRGQAMHQDQFYLKVQPGTCMAVWIALERADEENGCLRVVPGSHKLPVLCTEEADTTHSFTDVAVPVPQDMPSVPLVMEAGDAVFFAGSLIHGSPPNTTTDRFRRAITGHYIAASAQQVAAYYSPALRMDGTQVEVDASEGGGPCGVWVDRDGVPVTELTEEGPWRPQMQGVKA
ncbi:MAG TPA: phytanoyl-CoA dioxygenase [Candidatus Latescibacteria bacterium]|jgi:phytanoyl-CoA hydroxylase|nr:phytanoyl-CoA dioxygenase [Candidatus Latescibacterota bacterium]